MIMADKILNDVLRGSADANIRFSDLRNLLVRLGFEERIRGRASYLYDGWSRGDTESPAQRQQGEGLSGKASS